MSDRGRPPDPFGRGDRTIIRPNPGGRRPAQPAPPAAPPAAAAPAAAAPAAEDWVADPQRRPSSEAAPRPALLRRDQLQAPSENPVMRAAGPLLLALGQFRAGMVRAPSAALMEEVAQAIEEFERAVRAAGLTPDQVKASKYVLCATADDIVQNMPADDRHVWTQYSMLSRFFGERVGGVRFFEELERVKLDPALNYPVLELMHACLALGFEGIHRTSRGGAAALQLIQRNLYETLRRIHAQPSEELSPHWQGQALPLSLGRYRVPLWAITSVVGALLLGFYLALLFLLDRDVRRVTLLLADLMPSGTIEIARPEPAPPPPPPPPPAPDVPLTQLQRIRLALADQISARKANADQTVNEIIVTVGNVDVFATGQAKVLASFEPVAARIAETLEKEPGEIRIVGHTDNVPIRTVRFPSNYDLSVERARAVSELFRTRLSRPERLEVDGKGDLNPVAPNTTAEGRARNRRVEIMIPRAD